jgi:hypothetical protein
MRLPFFEYEVLELKYADIKQTDTRCKHLLNLAIFTHSTAVE